MSDTARALLSAMVTASGLSVAEFARMVMGRDERTVRRWLSGEIEIPDGAVRWLERADVSATSKRVTITVRRT